MTDATPEADDTLDDDEQFGPALAVPPLYALRTAVRCPACRQALHVFALGCAAFHDAEEGYPIREFHFLSYVRSVPDELTALLRDKCPSYFLDREDASDEPYLMNHCVCGAALDDDVLHGDIGAAFVPDTPDGYGLLTVFRLPIAEPIAVACSYAIGGGEYLSLAQAEAW